VRRFSFMQRNVSELQLKQIVTFNCLRNTNKILDTRKTTPVFGLPKMGSKIGGGEIIAAL
jgi:nicotinate-nucleotide pyrophosphorylase